MIQKLPLNCKISFFKGSGPGGQHKNKTLSGVRIVHTPTGTIITATERRSQSLNRVIAIERMEKRLAELRQKKRPRIATKRTRSSKERRLQSKKKRSLTKNLRGRFKGD